MASMILRFRDGEAVRWGRLTSSPPTRPSDRIEVIPLQTAGSTTGELVAGLEAVGANDSWPPLIMRADQLLSPITADATLLCQGLNYRDHAAEAGHHERKQNLLFLKASSALCGPYEDIVRPKGVELLDYEVEVGIVLRRDLRAGAVVTADTLGDYVAGVVLCNDVSARDVMFGASFLQWFQGKSYRTFCPAGPVLYLLEPGETAATLENLEIALSWRGERRQSASTAQLIYKPAETLTQVAAIMDLKRGDMVLTGTPGGVLANGTPRLIEVLSTQLLDDAGRRTAMIEEMKRLSDFLQPGDELALTLRDSLAGRDLGGQFSVVTAAP